MKKKKIKSTCELCGETVFDIVKHTEGHLEEANIDKFEAEGAIEDAKDYLRRLSTLKS